MNSLIHFLDLCPSGLAHHAELVILIEVTDSTRGGGGKGVLELTFFWVCAAGLSEHLPH